MSPTEFAFLALGLVLGIAVGAALAEVFRARPAPRREVRLTVSPNSIPPRARTTLASTDRPDGRPGASGGPAGDLVPTGPFAARGVMAPALATAAVGVGAVRTSVPSSMAGLDVSAAGPFRLDPPRPRPEQEGGGVVVAAAPAMAVAPAVAPVAAPVAAVPALAPAPPAMALPALDVGPAVPHRAIRVRPAVQAPARVTLAASAIGVPIRAEADPQPSSPDARPTVADSGPCGALRRVALERCEVAERARVQATAAADVLQRARRAYDVLRERVDQQERIVDPRELRAAKDAAHRTFREARAAARTNEDAEAAAREWLGEINRLNTAARIAGEALGPDREELRQAVPRLDRLAVEADAARIAAEAAEAGCREAREALADCEEAAATPPPVHEPEPEPVPSPWPADPHAATGFGTRDEDDDTPAPRHGGAPRVLRILRGDRAAREALVAGLAGSSPEEVRRWRLAFADLVDAVVARSIEDGYLEVDEHNGFWSMFDRSEQREIVSALSALGFRFDGLGGFADERVPAQRDLSLAVGYAGLDRMRIRNWPREADIARLFAGASVAADEWLGAHAPDLSLGRMIDALGNRAGELADVWNAWGRIRPLLLADD